MTTIENNRLLRPSQSTRPTINRLASVEEELTDRILREKNGEKIYPVCRKLTVLLLSCPSEEDREFQNTLCRTLMKSLNCTEEQAACLIELSLELVYAKRFGSYRSLDIDLGYLVATAAGMAGDRALN